MDDVFPALLLFDDDIDESVLILGMPKFLSTEPCYFNTISKDLITLKLLTHDSIFCLFISTTQFNLQTLLSVCQRVFQRSCHW